MAHRRVRLETLSSVLMGLAATLLALAVLTVPGVAIAEDDPLPQGVVGGCNCTTNNCAYDSNSDSCPSTSNGQAACPTANDCKTCTCQNAGLRSCKCK